MGASGDMLLGALLHAGADVDAVQSAVAALDLPVSFVFSESVRDGLAVGRVTVSTAGEQPLRTWQDIRALLAAAPLPEGTRELSLQVFGALAEAEAAVHGVAPENVHFHEVGALDALLDVVATCAAFLSLALDELVASPVALGGGSVATEHGVLPVPVPAVVELLRRAGAPVHGGPVDLELCTPTGAALLAVLASRWSSLPAGVITAVGSGAGTREVPGRLNAVRLLVVDTAAAEAAPDALLLETNVDDLEPRLWPGVISALLGAGASDAWLAPILMKKGRPAHTLSVLVTPDRAEAVRTVVFTETSAIGLREHDVRKHALERRVESVSVRGHQVRVKLALHEGRVVNAQPEWDDVASAAAALDDVSVKRLLAEAVAAAQALTS
jgi:uncharacterized protein (TIGR00299 family) protein